MGKMFDWLRKEKETEVTPDLKKQELVNDARLVLEILRNVLGYTGCDFAEVRQKFFARRGVVGEERIINALGLLAKMKLIAWGGKRESHIGFIKQRLPADLPLIEV